MSFLRTVLAFAYTVFCVAVYIPFALVALLISPLGLKKPVTWFIYGIAWFWSIGVITITGCTITVKGREHIPLRGGVCFVSNHGSIFDILLALAYIGRPFGFIAKKELLFIPLLNAWISLLGGLFIDRKNLRKALKTINRGIQRIEKGSGMLIFPEGHRSKGQGVLPFRSGAIKLATQSRAPIIPMAISGSYEVFEKDYRVHSGPVQVIFCPPVNTADMAPQDRRHKLAEQVRGIIQEALDTNLPERS